MIYMASGAGYIAGTIKRIKRRNVMDTNKYLEKLMNGEEKVLFNKDWYYIHFKEAGVLLKGDLNGKVIKIPKDWMQSVAGYKKARNKFILRTTDGNFDFLVYGLRNLSKRRDMITGLIYEKYLKSEIPEEGWD